MILLIFRFAKNFMMECFSYWFCNSRRNPRIVLSRKAILDILSVTTKVTGNCSDLCLNNCIQKKYKHHQSCIYQQSQVSSENKIPKAKESKTKQTSLKPDVPSLIMLLQAVGFQLREFEKQEVGVGEIALPKESIKVIINCGTSQMKAVLEMSGIDCQCPSEAKEGSLWSICGHAPSTNDSVSSSKYEETGSNLLPSISKGVTNVIRDVVYRLFKIMNNPSAISESDSENDLNLSAIGNVETTPNAKKSDSQESFSRSRTQPNIPSIRVLPSNQQLLTSKNLFCSTVNINDAKVSETAKDIPNFQREKTWDFDIDIDLRSNSPKLSSSPTSAYQTCASSEHISIGSEYEPIGFVDYVVKAYRCLDKAVNSLAKKAPIPSPSLSLNDQSFVKPTPPPSTKSASSSPKSTSRPGSTCSMPSRLPLKVPPVKTLNRRSIGAPISQKSTEKPLKLERGAALTPPVIRRQSLNTTSGLQKPSVPSRLIAPVARSRKNSTSSTSSMNSTTLSDKVLLVKKPACSPNVKKSPLIDRKTSIGANSSLKAPSVTTSRIATPTSIGTQGTKYGFSRNKQT